MLLLGILLSLISPNSENQLQPGIYESDNPLFLKLEISQNRDSVTFYFPEESSSSNGLQRSTLSIWPNYRHGQIRVEGDEILFESMESDFLPSTRPQLLPMKFEDDVIHLNCENMAEYMFRKPEHAECKGEFIEFRRTLES
ncbi:MAG: hypothetical protein HWE14_06960 [Flavobacteriia bacterium]|nr:hypothetical protein [Flavobacteriia bacterium]